MDRYFKVSAVLFVLLFILIPNNRVHAVERNVQLLRISIEGNDIDKDNTKKQDIEVTSKVKQAKQERRQIISLTNDELFLLSRLVTGEARGESYEGQVAVAAVVINRVQDDRFPDTIKDVIYQKNAFSVVNDGAIHLKPTESAYKAVEEAIYGVDPTGESVYFWNPDIATCKWIERLKPHLRIGNHVFAK
ncbi:cell wall hydrolase [Asaccharospora irregularis]|nr:cell wall hydrolase [Asaccharospora irregularis]